MAASETIRELLLKIGVEADKGELDAFDEGVDSLREGMSNLIEMAVAATAAIAGMAAGLVANTADVAENADEIDKQASALGISTKSYQELAYALDDVGVGADALPKLLGEVAASVTDAADASSPAAEALTAIGLSAEELAAMTPDEQLAAIMEGLSGVTDQTEKLELANTLLGGKSEALLPLMDAQGESLQDLADKAEAAGLIMSDETVAAGAELNDQLEALENLSKGLLQTLGADLIPIISELATEITDWYNANKEVIASDIQAFADEVADGFRAVADAMIAANEAVGGLEGWKELAEIVAALAGAAGLVYVGTQIYAIATGLMSLFSGLSAVATMLAPLWSLVELVMIWAPSMGLVEAATMALSGAVSVLLGPVTLIAAGIAATVAIMAVWLLYMQDLYTWITGGTSLIGTWVEKNREAGGVIGGLALVIEGLKNVAVAAFGLIATYFTTVWAAGQPFRDLLMQIAEIMMGIVTPAIGMVSDALGGLLGLIGQALSGLASLMGGGAALGAVGVPSMEGVPATAAAALDSAPAFSQGTTGSAGTNVTTGNTTVSITGAGITQEQAQALINDTLDQNARATAAALEGAPV